MASKLSPGRIRRAPGATLSINFVAAGHQPAYSHNLSPPSGSSRPQSTAQRGPVAPPLAPLLTSNTIKPQSSAVPRFRTTPKNGALCKSPWLSDWSGETPGQCLCVGDSEGAKGVPSLSLSLSLSPLSQDKVGVVKKSIRRVVDRSSLSGRLFSLFVEGWRFWAWAR